MSEIWWAVIALGGLAGLVAFFLIRRSRQKIADAWQTDPESRAHRVLNRVPPVRTPAGHEVHYETGLPQDLPLAAIDAGVEYTHRKMECLDYPVNRAQHRVRVVIFKSELSPESRTPSYRVPIFPGNPYWNSEWDMMRGQKSEPHYVLAGGQTIAVGEPFGDVFILPHSTDAALVERVSGFEMEHVDYAHYDGERFEATKYHQNGGHPITPDTCGSSFSDQPSQFAVWGMEFGKCTLLVK
jgi:hypothetical protein